MPKVNNRPKGEISPNLVTLIGCTKDARRRRVKSGRACSAQRRRREKRHVVGFLQSGGAHLIKILQRIHICLQVYKWRFIRGSSLNVGVTFTYIGRSLMKPKIRGQFCNNYLTIFVNFRREKIGVFLKKTNNFIIFFHINNYNFS
jgi:hypothetical protein